MKLLKVLMLWVGVGFSAITMAAGSERLDDSASVRSVVEARTVTDETGLPFAEVSEAKWMVSDFGLVQYRLATAAYKGKTAKIYYVIPVVINGLNNPQALRVTWQGSGAFVDGEGQAGDRKLVWTGLVSEDWMDVEFRLRMQVELIHLRLAEGQSFGFESYFEIETDE